jgi:hypothetical protein
MNNKHKNKYPLVNESLAENDLKWLVNEAVYIDMHKTKLGEDKDYLVLAIAVNDRNPAHDLATFIENGVYKFEDVEVSPATDSKGRYLVYVEIKRDQDAFKNISGILEDSSKLCGITEWKFKTLDQTSELDLDQDTFSANVITDPVEYEQRHPPKDEQEQEAQTATESIKKRLNFLLKY